MTTEQLGETRREFKPGLENLVAGIIIGLLMIGGGGALPCLPTNGVIESGGRLPFWAERGWCWGAVGILAALAIGLMIAGFFLIRWMRSLFSFRERIAQNGFLVSDEKTARVIGWEEILSVEETHIDKRLPLLKGVAKYALPKMMSKSFTVNVKQGEPFAFDGNMIKGHTKLAQMLKDETDP
jgi:hypothetical protein